MNNLNFTAGLDSAWVLTAAFIPKLFAFFVILVIGYFVAKILGKLFAKMLERVHFPKLVERGGVKKVLAKTGFDAADILGRILFYTIILFVLQMAFGVFGPNPISDLLTRIIAFLPNLFVALFIVIIAAAVAAGVKELLRVILGALGYGNILANVASAAVLIVGCFAALDQVGIAPNIVNGLYYAILAVFAGSAIVAIGGGGIEPMRERWQKVIAAADQEAPQLKAAVSGAKVRVEERAREITSKAEEAVKQDSGRPAPRVT